MADDASITASRSEHPAPPLTPERVLFRVQTLALLRVLGPKKGEQLLRAMAEILRDQDSLTEALPIRRKPEWHVRRDAQRDAAAAFRADVPILAAGLRR